MAAGNKTALKESLVNLLKALREYDGTDGKTSDDAIEKYASDFSDALDTYAKTLNIVVAPTDIASGALSNTGGTVIAANPFYPKITDSL